VRGGSAGAGPLRRGEGGDERRAVSSQRVTAPARPERERRGHGQTMVMGVQLWTVQYPTREVPLRCDMSALEIDLNWRNRRG
jgi:hypothetical protein